MKQSNPSRLTSEKGAVLVEFAVVAPILVLMCLFGYSLMRSSEMQMVRRDMARILTLSNTCNMIPPEQVARCYNDIIDGLTAVAGPKYKNIGLSVHTYLVVPPVDPTTCNTALALPLSYQGGYVTPNFPTPHYQSAGPTTDSQTLLPDTVSTAGIKRNHAAARMQLCQNSKITITEIFIEDTAQLFGSNPSEKTREVGFI